MYRYITDVEMEIFRHYKTLIINQEQNMTMLDLQSFIKKLNIENKEEEKHHNTGSNNWLKSLFAIGDIINYMRYKDTTPR